MTLRLLAENLACERGGRLVFSGLDFAVGAGEALIVTGPNGAGKSSLLRLVAGLVRPSGGALRLLGGDGERSLPEQVHYLGHQDALKPALDVAENLSIWRDILGPSGLAVRQALAALGLESLAALPAGFLSAGQRRRLALARLLATRRPIWLLDEPTTALDQAAQKRLIALVEGHLQSGGLALIATHDRLALSHAVPLILGGPHL